MSVLTSDNCSNAWFSVVAHRGVGHVRSQEDHLSNELCNNTNFQLMIVHEHNFVSTHRLVENFWSDGWNQDRVHSSQFYIDLGLTR